MLFRTRHAQHQHNLPDVYGPLKGHKISGEEDLGVLEDIPEVYGPLKGHTISGEEDIIRRQEQKKLGVALQIKLACAKAEAQIARAKAEADAEAKLAAKAEADAKLPRELARVKAKEELAPDETLAPALQSQPQSPSMERCATDFPREGDSDWDEFYDLGYRPGDHLLSNIPNPKDKRSDLTTIHDVYSVDDELKLTPTTSTVTITTAILTTPHIGRRIRKKFFGKWHSGIITSSDEEDLYHVKYDDGDSEDLDHDEMHKCLLSHEENESIAKKKKENNAKHQQRFRDAKKANVRTNTFVIIMIATCLILFIV